MASKTKLLAICGAVAAVGAAALFKRDKVTALLPFRTGGEAPPAPVPPPQQSNYDAPGPVANTATPVPAPDPQETPPPAIDEVAEEQAAAAEAGAIGGTVADYVGSEGEPVDEATRPLAEAGEGESEGEEQAEAELVDNAVFRDDAPSDAERQIDETIEAADQPQTGETLDTVAEGQGTFLPPEPPVATPTDETSPEMAGGGISGRPNAGLPTENADAGEGDEPKTSQRPGDGDDSDDWRTWSGRSVKP
jgi:hypothetical protein